MLVRWIALVTVAILVTAGCSESSEQRTSTPSESDERAPSESPRHTSEPSKPSKSPTTPDEPGPADGPPRPRVAGTVASNLTTPWGLVLTAAGLPDGSALISERNTAKIKRISPSGDVNTVGTVPDVQPPTDYGEGGLLGIAVRDDTLYAYHTTEGENRVVAMPYSEGGLGKPRVLIDGIPQAEFHNGGRIVFGPDGFLYVATGDGGDPSNAQDPDSLGGKILRIDTDGSPAPGNPFDGSPVWSLGHRNVEGLAFDPYGRLWASEFGEDTWDELNLIKPGKNYGWPDVEGMGSDSSDYRNPVEVWSTDEASPAGLAYADGALWMAALRGERLWRIPLDVGGRDGARVAGDPKAFFTSKYGRLRTVETAPDGSLWLTTSDTDGRTDPSDIPNGADRILRLVLR